MKELIRKIISLLVVMIMLLMPITAISALDGEVGAKSNPATVSTFDELKVAVATAPTDGTQYYIKVTDNILITDQIDITDGRNILIFSEGTGTDVKTLTRGINGKTLLKVITKSATSHSTLTLENIIIDGAKNDSNMADNSFPLITLYNPGTLNLNKDTVLQNNSSVGDYGGAVKIIRNADETDYATFSMDGATIRNNAATYGGGVSVNNGVVEFINPVTIKDSIISENIATASGGGIYGENIDLTVTGSTKINNNTAKQSGGGVQLSEMINGKTVTFADETEICGNITDITSTTSTGGGIYLRKKSSEQNRFAVYISDKVKIQNNQAYTDGGIYTYGANVDISTESPISGNIGVGTNADNSTAAIYTQDGDLTLKDKVTVTNNYTKSGKGYAVYVLSGILNMKKGSIVTENGDATKGLCGGVKINQGAINMDKGSEISSNSINGGGAGLYMSAADGFIYGKISLNQATDSGGGIYIHGGRKAQNNNENKKIYIDEAEISNNTAAKAGGGIYVNGPNTNETTDPRAILDVIDGKITGNSANGTDATGKDSGGGGIAVARGQAIIREDAIITNNYAKIGAGGVQVAKQNANYIGSGKLTILGGDISNNRSENQGLGIQSVLYGEIIIDSSFVNAQEMFVDSTSTLTIKGGKSINGISKVTFPVTDGTNTYLVTVDPSGGQFALGSGAINGLNVTLPNAEKTGFTFENWSDGTNTYASNTSIAISADTTLTAVQVLKAGVAGRIINSLSSQQDITVQLVQGSTVVATTTPNSNGDYLFTNITQGLYDIVVKEGNETLFTQLINVNATAVTVDDITLNSERNRSIVEIASGTPKVVVGELDTLAQSQTNNASIFKLIVAKKNDTDTTEQAAIKTQATEETIIFIDMTLTQQENAGSPVDIGANNTTVFEVVYPFDFTGKTAIRVYRYHGGEVEKFEQLSTKPASSYVDGTYYLDDTNNRIYIYASKYSTFAIGYDGKTERPNTGDASIDTTFFTVSTLVLIGTIWLLRKSRKYEQ